MSNYVHNYVYCSIETEKDLQKREIEDVDCFLGTYDYISTILADGRVCIRFDTHGMEYRSEFIVPFIENHKETNWLCVEENEIEEGWFRWENDTVLLTVRPIEEAINDCFMEYQSTGNNYCPYYTFLIFESGRIVFEDIMNNKKSECLLSSKSIGRIIDKVVSFRDMMKEYRYYLPAESETDRVELYIDFDDPNVWDHIETFTPKDWNYYNRDDKWKDGNSVVKEITDTINKELQNADATFKIKNYEF